MSTKAKRLEDDRTILIAALKQAVEAYRQRYPIPTLLGPGPTSEMLDDLGKAIERCNSYQVVAGKVLFNGISGPIITSAFLAPRLFDRLGRWNAQNKSEEDFVGAADWLIRILTTETTEGRFKVAVWGLSVDKDLTIARHSRIMPFDALANTDMKRRILDRAKVGRGDVVWLSQNYYGIPSVAVETVVKDFPFIGADGACFARIAELNMTTKKFWSFTQGATVGRPLAMCSWFDYSDQDFEISEWEKWADWLLPEMHPRITSLVSVQASAIKNNWKDYLVLPGEMRSDLLRSIDRFLLSQCRQHAIDQVLDLALAFEIAVGGGRGDNAPASWKVGVRSSQMIGGALAVRQTYREHLNGLYRFRSRATHGGRMDANERAQLEVIVNECSKIYVGLIQSFLRFRAKPDWREIELEPTST